MNESVIHNIIQAGVDSKADFAEVYMEEARSSSMLFKDKNVESASAGTDFGIGIRLLYGTEVLYAYSSSENEKELIELTKALAASRKCQYSKRPNINLKRRDVTNIHRISRLPIDVQSKDKVAILQRADQVARATSEKIQQVSATVTDSSKYITIANSEGLLTEDNRIRSRFTVSVTAADGSEMFTGSETPAMKGFEFFDNLNIPFYAERAAQRALLMLNAGYISGGQMPVVMGNAFGGVIFHEACGHPLETESIRKKLLHLPRSLASVSVRTV